MISTVLLSLAPVFLPASPPAVATPLPTVQEDAEVIKRMAEAGDDVDNLLELAAWCKENDKAADGRKVYKRIVELDPSNEAAHKALRHHFYDGQWFESYVSLSKYKRAEAKRMKDQGLARFGDKWVPAADVAYLRMGWEKNDADEWVSGAELYRKATIAAYEAEGRELRTEDSDWVHPDDFSKWTEGLFACGDEWLPLDEANTFHSTIGQWWERQSAHYVVDSTLDNKTNEWVAWYADSTWPDLVRALGKQPDRKPTVVVLNSIQQYNTFAGGDQNLQIQPAEATGISSIHYAFFADAWFVPGGPNNQTPVYKGAGVAYFDPSFGQYAVRHAAAHSYMEALDPSWNAISEMLAGGAQGFQAEAFWGEKQMPRWFRYGLASYCERYARNPSDNDNPWSFRDWALENLRSKGGLRSLEELFEFVPNVENIEGSTRWINECGLLVAFMLDGESSGVRGAHGAFKKAFGSERGTEEAIKALQAALIEDQDALLKFAGMEFAPEATEIEASADSSDSADSNG